MTTMATTMSSSTNTIITTTTTTATTIITSSSHNNTKTMQHFCEFLAGAIASGIATFILQPFDVIRLTQMANETTLMFTIREIYNSSTTNYDAANSNKEWSTKKKFSLYRLCNFYRALPISMMAYMLTYSIYFPINSYLKRENPLHLESRYLIYIFANIPPAIISMTICNPLWVIKARIVSNNFEQIGVWSTALCIYKASGCRGFTKGLTFGYLNNINSIITFTLYDVFKDFIAVTAGYTGPEQYTTLDLIICSLASKTIATIIAYPLLALRIRHQTQDNQSLGKLVASVFTKHPKTLYYGLTPTLAQQLPKNTITMIFYEFILQILNF